MRSCLIVVILMLTGVVLLNAQKKEIANGYIIDNDSVKVAGFVQLNNDFSYITRVKFSEQSKTKKFPLIKVKSAIAYGFEETGINNMSESYKYWRYFMRYELDRPAKALGSNTSFIERVVDGSLEVYRFLYETPSNLNNPISTRYVVFQDDKEICQIEDDNFIESSKSLFEGYTALIESLGDMKFRFDNFIRLTEDYNYWIENRHDPNTYKLNPIIFKQ